MDITRDGISTILAANASRSFTVVAEEISTVLYRSRRASTLVESLWCTRHLVSRKIAAKTLNTTLSRAKHMHDTLLGR